MVASEKENQNKFKQEELGRRLVGKVLAAQAVTLAQVPISCVRSWAWLGLERWLSG